MARWCWALAEVKAVAYMLMKCRSHSLMFRNPSSGQFSYAQLTKSIVSASTQQHYSLGMYPLTGFEIPYEFLSTDHYLFDLIYNPAITLF